MEVIFNFGSARRSTHLSSNAVIIKVLGLIWHFLPGWRSLLLHLLTLNSRRDWDAGGFGYLEFGFQLLSERWTLIELALVGVIIETLLD